MNNINLTVSEDSIQQRLDHFICTSIKDLSRSLIQQLIKDNLVLVNDKPSKAGYKLKSNDTISIDLPSPKELDIKPEKVDLEIAFEDKDLVVINKPQGMVTHPASGIYEGTLVNAVMYHCKDSLSGINGVLRPGIVHRLDKETSGLIIVCKNDKAHNEIAKQLKTRKVKRYYYAIVHGKVKFDKGTINKPVGRHKIHRHKIAIVPNGKFAITHWKVLKRSDKYSLVECNLETGRTHQIRVHMASIHHEVVGDKTYGKNTDLSNGMMLHAYKLIFNHPTTGKEITLETDMPERIHGFVSRNFKD